ncbi:MAG: hypothetical protein ACE3JP_16345 [Ectobacillus sp.]
MQKEIWKWIFQELNEENLYDLIIKSQINVDGFRKIRKPMVKQMKIRIIAELLNPKTLKRIKATLRKGADDGRNSYSAMTKEQLHVEMADREKAIEILAFLLSTDEEGKEEWAIELYTNHIKAGQAVSLEPQVKQEDDYIKPLQAIIRDLEEKLKKQETKNIQYAAKLNSLEQHIGNKEKEIKKREHEMHNLKKQIYDLKKQSDIYEAQCIEQKQKIAEMDKEIKQKNEEVQEKINAIQAKQEEINRLNALCLTLSAQSKKVAWEGAAPDEQHKIAILGDVNESLVSSEKYTVFPLETIEQALEEHTFTAFRYICLMRFSMTPSSLRKVKKRVEGKKLKEFYNMHEFLQWEGSVC